MTYDWQPLIDLAREAGMLSAEEHAAATRRWAAARPLTEEQQRRYDELLAQGYSPEYADRRVRAASRAARPTA